MPRLGEAGSRHSAFYSALAKQYRDERAVIWAELPNLLPAYQFLASGNGRYDLRLVELVSNLQIALNNDVYWQQLIPMFVEGQNACARLRDDTNRAVFLLSLAQMYTNLAQYEQALSWIAKATSLAHETGNLEALADSYHRMGWTHIYLGELQDALKHLEKARQFAQQCNQLSILASSLHFTARAYFELGDYQRALEFVHAELRSPPETRNQGDWAFAWLRIAQIFFEMGRLKMAERLTLRSLRMFESLGVKGNRASSLSTLARIRFQQDQVEESLNLLSEALQKIGYTRGEMDVRQNMVEIYLHIGELNEALKLINEIINYRESAKERRRLADALYLKGKILEVQGSLSQSVKCYEDSIALFEKMQCLPTVTEKVSRAVARLKRIVREVL